MSSAVSASTRKVALPLLLTLPASRNQLRLLLVAIFALVAGFGLAAPFSGVQLVRVDAFLPAYEIALLICDLVTSALLFSQFSVLGSRALLVLACGYLFTALMVIPHLLTFPGVVQPTGLIGGPNSPPWVYAFWHAGFPLTVIAYSLLKSSDLDTRHWQHSARVAILAAVACVVVLVFGLTMIATRGERLLPPILLASGVWAGTWWYIAAVLWLLSLTALIVVWTRIKSVLDVLLCVVLCAWLIEISLNSFLSFTRYTVGWYSGRFYGFVAATFVLIALIVETTALFARLARANLQLENERDNKLMDVGAITASIAHEVRQPLAAIASGSNAALRFLNSASPDIQKVQTILKRVASESYRASEVFDSIRAMFRKTEQQQQAIDLNAIILETLRSLREELIENDVTCRTELIELPNITGHKSQLRQVIFNLARNALEAMDTVSDRSRILTVGTKLSSSEAVAISIADSGPGIDPKRLDEIFDTFVTTKSSGLGLGLAICRTIIEGHGGQLKAISDGKMGARFEFTLPIEPVDATLSISK